MVDTISWPYPEILSRIFRGSFSAPPRSENRRLRTEGRYYTRGRPNDRPITVTPDAHITVDGETPVRIPVPLPEDHGYETATVEEAFRCSTGDVIAEGWAGLAVDALLLDADVPGQTTHLQVEGEDGFTVCIPVGAALDGVLTFESTGGNVESEPRFAAPGISGTRTVKGVRRIRPVTLDPSEHPEEREDLTLAETDDE